MTIPVPDLPEKDFINEGYSKDPYPFWEWMAVISVCVVLLWAFGLWFNDKMDTEVADSPFLQVTNRELSLFLWQFSDKMRIHAKNKTGYLPGFQYQESVAMELDEADEYAIAPPELLYLYHTWKRLISDEIPLGPIALSEFREFINYAEEWKPRFWPAAPEGYVAFINSLEQIKDTDLRSLPATTLPIVVRQAFQGWKNYMKDQDKINQLRPTYGEMEAFLKLYPHYARNYWRNIVDSRLHYLYTLTWGQYNPNDVIPQDELAAFLRQAFYNYHKVR